MAPFRHLLHDQRLWGIRRKTVVPALALGLFVACMPFPGHPLVAALLALVLRVHIPVAALTTFLSNPLTMGPLYYFNFRIGAALLSRDPSGFEFDLSMDWVANTFVLIWQPMLLGSVLVGAIASLIGFMTLDAIWRYSIHDYKSRKRQKRG